MTKSDYILWLICLQVHADKMRESLTMDMLATDLADYLVRKGVRSDWYRFVHRS
jgi:argininosuccinate lyase